jgi:hypothetical protein
VLKLGRDVMPVLSGWGQSVGLIGLGLLIGGISAGIEGFRSKFFTSEVFDDHRDAFNTCVGFFAICLLAMPFVFAVDAASVSSKCAKLEDEINAIRGEDPGFMRAMSFSRYVKKR